MEDTSLLLQDFSPISRRVAIVSEEGDSIWLSLTDPEDSKRIHDCWILNLATAPDAPDAEAYQRDGHRPPAPRTAIQAEGVIDLVPRAGWTFHWSRDGHAVVIRLDGTALGMVSATAAKGRARYLVEDGDCGHAWDDAAYQNVFGQA